MTNETANSNNVQGMLDQSSATIREYLQRAVPVLRNNLTLLRSNSPEDGLPALVQCAEGLQLINEFLHSASNAKATDNAGLSASYGAIASKVQTDLQLIISAMENKDMALLADVMEFELIDSLEQLQQLLSR